MLTSEAGNLPSWFSKRLSKPSQGEPPRAQGTLVSVIVVTYKTPREMLRRCLGSVIESHYRPIEVVVVDNSPGADVANEVQAWRVELPPESPEIRFLGQGRNSGYAAATNRGVAVSSGQLLLMLNPDAVLEPEAVAALVVAADRRPEAIGFAPKVVLESDALILDSVGIDLYRQGQGGQRGLGEPDIGQFDIEERVAGLCFAAALTRRSAFMPERVGELDERYFMFYEDVDWSMRAVMRGEEFWSVPSARVHHVHSASTRHMGSGFKTRLIQRNLIWTVAKNLERRRAVRMILTHTARNLLGGALGRHPWLSVRIVVEAWAGLPALAGTRRDAQRRRRRSDSQVLSEPAKSQSFDTTRYQPSPSVETLLSVLSRLYVAAPEPTLGSLVFRLTQATRSSGVTDSKQIAAWVRESGVTISPALDWLLQRLETDGG